MRRNVLWSAGVSVVLAALVWGGAAWSAGPAGRRELAGPDDGERTPPTLRDEAGGGGLKALSDLGAVREDEGRVWTFMAYLSADNNLENELLEDLNEMEAGLPEKGLDAVVLIDRAKGHDASDGDWTDARVYRVRRDKDPKKLASELLASPGELHMGSPATLETFVAAAMRTFPAKRYALLLGGHASGWPRLVPDDDPGGASGPDAMDVVAARKAIRRALAAAKVEKLDLLCMDACLLGQFEVADELRDAARVLVASEAIVPPFGLPYEKVLPDLAGSTDPAAAARSVVKHFGDHCKNVQERDATMSALDLGKADEAREALRALVEKLRPAAGAQWPALCRSMYYAESYGGRKDFLAGRAATASVDLLDCLKRMRASVKDFPAETEYQKLTKVLPQFVLASYAGRARRLSQGLAVYAPIRRDTIRAGYGLTHFARHSGWLGLLGQLYMAHAREASVPEVTDARLVDRAGKEIPRAISCAGHGVRITVVGKNILWTIVEHLQPVEEPKGLAVQYRTFVWDLSYDERKKKAAEEASDMIDLIMPQYADGGNELLKPVTGLTMRVTNGEDTVDATIDFSDPSDLRTTYVPAQYSHPSTGDIDVDIAFDTNWLDAKNILYTELEADFSVTMRYITPAPDAKVSPYYAVVAENGDPIGYKKTGTLRWGKGLKLIPLVMPAGKYKLAVHAQTVVGRTGRKVFDIEMAPGPKLTGKGKFNAGDLVGVWKWSIGTWSDERQEYEYTERDLQLTFLPDAKDPSVLGYGLKGDGVDLKGFARFDDTSVPNLNFFTQVDREKVPEVLDSYFDALDLGYARTDFFLAELSDDKTALTLYEPHQQKSFRAIRQIGGGIVGGGNLVGTWRTADGNITLLITPQTYTTYLGMLPIDAGIYRVEAGKLVCTSTLGKVTIHTFTLKGNTLTLTNPDGQTYTLTRAQ